MTHVNTEEITFESLFGQLPTQLELGKLADRHAPEYKRGEPYPHIVLDNVLPDTVLDRVLGEFPDPSEQKSWSRYDNALEAKLELSGEEHWGACTRALMHYMNAQPFLRFLERLTGIDNLIPDPHFQGAGLHQTVGGGYLKVHADFNKNPKNELDRRLNVLVYLNKEWEESYGGHFEMWDREMEKCVKKVLPVFNRMVVFSTTDFSYHGLPDPLACPEGWSRKSLALYYYTNGRPSHEISQDPRDNSTLFKLRPGEEQASLEEVRRRLEQRLRRKQFVKSLIPPILWNKLAKLKSRAE